ncbi:MAG: hypothetical protein K1000chlam1_01129, partial [Candidatus Anoxychlamydiales bacterium]|nr:hypothetical protein [Candidatus Anoxychlamydiales bacterium]
YDGMVVDIVYKNSSLATLNQDKGIENIIIKLYPPQIDECWDLGKVIQEQQKYLLN